MHGRHGGRTAVVTRLVRGTGWVLIVGGAVVLLYVVYLLWFTNFETERQQRELAETWERTVARAVEDDGTVDGAVDSAVDGAEPDPAVRAGDEGAGVDLGEAYAAIWFERDGERIVTDEVLYVVEGVTLELLQRGPGHYPASDRPGGAGNLAIAGHRTTYGAPFWSLDELADGDTIHVVGRDGTEWVYAYREQRVVAPSDVWVVDEDPLGTGMPTVTLTTCHPRGSARERLIAWGELVGDPRPALETGSET